MNSSVASKSTAVANKADGVKVDTHTVFVYGTLKSGFYNNDYWFKDAKLIGNDTLGGFVMINLGPYPAIAKINNPTSADYFGVSGELWEVPDNEYRPVKAMEEGAGYTTVTAMTDGGVRAEVFIMHDFVEGNYSWIKKKSKNRDSEVAIAPRNNIPF
jgi:gamma-glutamylcyclotransferase (GGCT)/AIG2-like uncharacterized protein YtfP